MFRKILLLSLIGSLFSCGSSSTTTPNRDKKENKNEVPQPQVSITKNDFINFSIAKIDEDLERNDTNYTQFKSYINSNQKNIKAEELNDAILTIIAITTRKINEENREQNKVIALVEILLEELDELDLNKKINGVTLLDFFLINKNWEIVEYFFVILEIPLNLSYKDELMQAALSRQNLKLINCIVEKLGLDFHEGILHQLLKFYSIDNNLEKVTAILIKGLDKKDIEVIAATLPPEKEIDSLIVFILNQSIKEENGKRENISELIKNFFVNEELEDKFKERFELSLNALLRNNSLETDEFSSIISLIQIFNSFKVEEKFKIILGILKDKGIDINREVNGDTALHMAVRRDLIEIIEILAKNGARFNIKGSGPRAPTALGLAIQERERNPKIINKIKALYNELNFEIHPEDKRNFDRIKN